MAEVASAFVSLLPSAKGFGSKLDGQIGGDLDKAGRKGGGIFGKAFAAVAAVGAGLAVKDFMGDSLEEAREAQKVGALTESIIKSTGGAANVTAKQVGDLAGAISNKIGVDDEAIQSGANLLLTFKQVRNEAGKGNDVFNRATQAAADLSAAGFGDLNGQAKMLGKALNDPIKGMTAMARSGVTFTESQKKQVKALVESGKTLEAQKIILNEVESQVGGAAAASATAGEKAAVAWGNFKEQVGTAMLPAVDAAANAFSNVLAPAMSKSVDAVVAGVGKIGTASQGVWKILVEGDYDSGLLGLGEDHPIVDMLFTVREMATGIWGAFSRGGKTFDEIGASVGRIKDTIADAFGGGGGGSSPLQGLADSFRGALPAIVGAAGTAGKVLRKTILPAVEQVVTAFITHLAPALSTAANTFKTVVLPAILSVGGYLLKNLWPILKQVWNIIATQVIPIVGQLAVFFYGTLYPAIVKIVVSIGQQLKPVFDAIFQVITGTVLPAVSKLLARFKEWLPTIQRVVMVVLRVVAVVLKFAAVILAKVLPPLIKFAGWLIGKMVAALSTVIGWVIKIIGWVLDFGGTLGSAGKKVAGFVSGIKDKFGEALAFVKGIPGKIVKALGDLTGLLVDSGKDLIRGIWDGIKGMGGWLKDQLVAWAKDHIPGPFRKVLGIGSPSKVMAAEARWIPIGIAEGIESESRTVQNAVNGLAGGLSVPRVAPDIATTGGGYGGRRGSRLQLVLADGRALDAYVREVADGSVADARAFAGTRARMG